MGSSQRRFGDGHIDNLESAIDDARTNAWFPSTSPVLKVSSVSYACDLFWDGSIVLSGRRRKIKYVSVGESNVMSV